RPLRPELHGHRHGDHLRLRVPALAHRERAFGPSHFSLDALIERRWPAWKRLAEIRSGTP
ncbi:MAG: hypothetical protein AABX97_05820, partial [Candidatus Thermoplasmatota archaeon]